jgi:hypothetical protein
MMYRPVFLGPKSSRLSRTRRRLICKPTEARCSARALQSIADPCRLLNPRALPSAKTAERDDGAFKFGALVAPQLPSYPSYNNVLYYYYGCIQGDCIFIFYFCNANRSHNVLMSVNRIVY